MNPSKPAVISIWALAVLLLAWLLAGAADKLRNRAITGVESLVRRRLRRLGATGRQFQLAFRIVYFAERISSELRIAVATFLVDGSNSEPAEVWEISGRGFGQWREVDASLWTGSVRRDLRTSPGGHTYSIALGATPWDRLEEAKREIEELKAADGTSFSSVLIAFSVLRLALPVLAWSIFLRLAWSIIWPLFCHAPEPIARIALYKAAKLSRLKAPKAGDDRGRRIAA